MPDLPEHAGVKKHSMKTVYFQDDTNKNNQQIEMNKNQDNQKSR